MAHQITLVNAEALKKLPPDLQKLIADKSAEWSPKYFSASQEADQAAIKNMRDQGVTFTVPTSAEVVSMKSTLQPMWSKWADKNGPVAADLLAKAITACK